MDYSWPQSSLQAPHGGSINLLDDGDNLLLDLDDKTLQPAGNDAEAGPSHGGKRQRQGSDFCQWLASGFPRSADAEENGCEDDSAGEDAAAAAVSNGAGCKAKGRKKVVNDAAAVKATREKARRERLNEYFDELSRLCDPSGKAAKADRLSVVADAIRVVSQLRVENNQLRQLNKFLEERVGTYERARAQAMFQQAAAAAHQHQAAVHAQQHAQQLPAQPPLGQQQPQQQQQAPRQEQQAYGSAFGGPMEANQAPHASYACPAPASAQPAGSAAALSPLGQGMPVAVGSDGVQYALVPIHAAPPGTLGAHVMALKQPLGGPGAGQQQHQHQQPAGMAGTGTPPVLPPGAPPVGWLPAPDLREDQKLRPPAA